MEINLKQWHPKDLDTLINMIPNIDSKFLRRDFPKPYTREYGIRFLENCQVIEEKGAGIYRAILCDGKTIGNVSINLNLDNMSQGVIGYYILPNHYGKGICTQVVKLAIQEAVDVLKAKEILAYIDERNIASKRVLEKNGFSLFRAFSNETIKGNQKVNVEVYRKII